MNTGTPPCSLYTKVISHTPGFWDVMSRAQKLRALNFLILGRPYLIRVKPQFGEEYRAPSSSLYKGFFTHPCCLGAAWTVLGLFSIPKRFSDVPYQIRTGPLPDSEAQ